MARWLDGSKMAGRGLCTHLPCELRCLFGVACGGLCRLLRLPTLLCLVGARHRRFVLREVGCTPQVVLHLLMVRAMGQGLA